MNIEEEGKRVIRIIKRIKSDRNRACYQNILALAKRENKGLYSEHIKEIVKNLVERNIITNINKDKPDMESFKLVSTEIMETDNDKNNKIGDDNTQSTEQYINDKFYETLTNKIKQEVKNAIKAETSNDRKRTRDK